MSAVSLTYNFTTSLQDALPENQLVYSPLSVLIALCMAALGAGGKTLSEMERVLECNHERNQFLVQSLKKHADSVDMTNAMFPLASRELSPAFKEAMTTQYGALAFPQDYIEKPRDSRSNINSFIAQRTDNRIQNLLPEGSITKDTRNVLVSTIHFEKDWAFPFSPQATQNANFSSLNDQNIDVQMMSMSGTPQLKHIDYGNGVEGLILPFTKRPRAGNANEAIPADEDFEMLFVKPKEATIYALDEAEMTALTQGNAAIAEMQHFDTVKIPKFSVSSQLDLKAPLQEIGIVEAFDKDRADFSKMFASSSGEHIYLSDVIHQAKMDVNEAGVKASAATAAIMANLSMPTDTHQFVLDRAFLAILRYKGEEVFVARVTKPQWEGSV